MAKIRNSNPKQSGGGYERLVGDADMASIFTKAQSTVISNGTELEKIISNKSTTIDDLDAFIDDCDNGTVTDGTYCGGPAPKPYTALVDDNGKVVATLRKEVEYFDTHMAGKPETYDVWEWK